MKTLFILLCVGCLASCHARQERNCTFVVEGACVDNGGYEEITEDMIQSVFDITYHFYAYMYNVSFSPVELAKNADLYIMIRSVDEVEDVCGTSTGGCYYYNINEIYVSLNDKEHRIEEMLHSLVHEMLHFWNDQYLQHQRPELFGDDLFETEESHSAPNMFSGWCRQRPEEKCVEDLSEKYVGWSL